MCCVELVQIFFYFYFFRPFFMCECARAWLCFFLLWCHTVHWFKFKSKKQKQKNAIDTNGCVNVKLNTFEMANVLFLTAIRLTWICCCVLLFFLHVRYLIVSVSLVWKEEEKKICSHFFLLFIFTSPHATLSFSLSSLL